MKSIKIAAIIIIIGMAMTACGPGKLFGPTLTPTPTSTLTPTSTPTPTITFTPTFTPTITPTNTPSPTPTQMGDGLGKFVFSLRRKDFIAYYPDLKGEINVFSTNLDGTNLTPITNGLRGYNIVEGVSPDGQQLLVASVSYIWGNIYGDLYVMSLDGSKSIKLTNRYSQYDHSAFWLSNGSKIVYIANTGTENAIFVVNPDGSNPIQITKPHSFPAELMPTADDTAVYWRASCDAQQLNSSCSSSPWRKTSIDGSDETVIWEGLYWDPNSSNSKLSDFIAYQPGSEASDVYISNLSLDQSISTGPSLCSPCKVLSPDGTKLFLKNMVKQSVNKYHTTAQIWFFSKPLSSDVSVVDLPEEIANMQWTKWSPDSRLLVLTEAAWNGGNLPPKIFDVEKMQVLLVLPEVMNHELGLYWLP